MPNLNEIPTTDDADEAQRWAVWEEFTLRQEAWRRHEEIEWHGVVGAFNKIRDALVGTEGLSERA